MNSYSSFYAMVCRSLGACLALWTCSRANAGLSIAGKQYEISSVEIGSNGAWVVYPKGSPRIPANKAWLSHQVLLEIHPGFAQPDFNTVPNVASVASHGRYVVVKLRGGPDAAITGSQLLSTLPGIARAEPMLARQQQRRFVPNDPYFAYDSNLPGYQWHLSNTGQFGGIVGVDINVVQAWDEWQGSSVRIGIVDDGLEVTHPDLVDNVDTVNDYDFNFLDDDPSPGSADLHGTACAGIAAARGDNALGVTGTAPFATLVGLRLIAAATTDADEAAAFAYKKDLIAVKSNSWGPYDGGFGAGGPGVLSAGALEDAATTGRGGLGTVFVWAAGNGNQNGDDSNYDGWAASPYAIAASAITDTGKQSSFSEPGANILVCTPSSGSSNGITTTDRTGSVGYNAGGGGDYTDSNFTRTFGGTSTSSPIIAGVASLILEAHPTLSYRDVQEILVRSARKNDPADASWVTNGAGFHFNVKYGAGLVDAFAATTLAIAWTNLPPLVKQTHQLTALNLAIPDDTASGVSQGFPVTHAENLRVEHVTVELSATHGYRGQLSWYLTSPSGIRSRLARSRINDTEADLQWTFMSTHFWGERSEGDWRLTVVDETRGYTGILNSINVTFYGTPAAEDLPLPVITSNTGIVGREGASFDYQLTASNLPTSYGATGLPPGVNMNPTTGKIAGLPLDGGGTYIGSLSATNATGETTVPAIFQVLPADPALATAVEQPASAFIVPFGNANWFSQTTTTQDGVDAAQSGDVGDNAFCGMEMTVLGPTTMTFQWKVSSEPGYDYLIFAVDGRIVSYTSGEQDWAAVNYSVGPGTHTVNFNYFKDESVSTGTDAGWIDTLVLTPITTAPTVTSGDVSGYNGVLFGYQITATNAPTLYAASGLPTGLSVATDTGLISGTTTELGIFPITISATNDFGTGSAVLTLRIGSLAEGLAAATEAPCQIFTTNGNTLWSPQVLYAHDGVDAARSGAIGDLSQSEMATLVTGPADGSFYWGISSENTYDFLRFYLDGNELPSIPGISGEVGWTQKTFSVPAGSHQLKWVYAKDDFVRAGLDAGFVDQLVITPTAVIDEDLDGYPSVLECYFGTSDSRADQHPLPTMQTIANDVTLSFPSVPGNAYRIECSSDLITWNLLSTITASSSVTSFTDLNGLMSQRCYYRIVIPTP